MRRNNNEGSLYFEKRNGKKYWRAQVNLGLDENGKQIRKTVSGYNKDAVLKKMQEIEKTRGLLSLNVDLNGTVQDLYKSWAFLIKKPHIQPLSFSAYEETYRLRLIDTRLGLTEISKVSSLLCQKHFNDLREFHSEYTLKRALRHLNSFFNYAVDEAYILRNPCKNVKIQSEIKIQDDYKSYSREDQIKIINTLDLSDPVDMMIYVAFASGLRLGELAALTWDDFKDGALSVSKQYSRNSEKNIDGTVQRSSEVRSLKTTSSYRIVPLPPATVKELKRYKINQFEYKLAAASKGYTPNNLIFANEYGNYQNPNRPTRRMESVCKKAGVAYITFHAIRHSYITRLFEEGVDFKKIQNLAGHSSIETTLNIYTHTNKEMLVDSVNVLSNIFKVK